MCTRFDSEVNSHTSTRKLVTTLVMGWHLDSLINSWNSGPKFEIPILTQGGTMCLLSLVKNSE